QGFIETLTYQLYGSQWFISGGRSENTEFAHPEALDAHVNVGEAFDLFEQHFGLNSFDNQGAPMVSMVNIPDQQMLHKEAWIGGPDMGYFAYGIATGAANGGMDCISCSRDIVVHEYTHAIIDHTARLEYRNEPGALNESIADIMAAVLDQDGDPWLIGEETGT